MQIKILQEGKNLSLFEDDEAARKFFREHFFGSYSYEWGQDEKHWLLRWDDIVDFVGIICRKNIIYLSLPKTASYYPGDDKTELLIRYGKLLEMYFSYVEWQSGKKKQWWASHRKNIAAWCENPVPPKENSIADQFIAVVQFEKVFEWMISVYFDNQINLEQPTVFFESKIKQWYIDINDEKYRLYEWKPINVRTPEGLKPRAETFKCSSPKRNIPDVVIDGECNGQKYCAVIDAKYYGWDAVNGSYHLPANVDLYKQFFYQEQFGQIYRSEGYSDVKIYNLFFFPDYLGDAQKLMRHCACVEFTTHPDHVIGVWQIRTDRLIDEILSGEFSVSRESFAAWLAENKKIKPI
jgi:hypothetical protein